MNLYTTGKQLYDGMPLTCMVFEVIKGYFASGNGTEYVRWANFTGVQTAVGSSANTFVVNIANMVSEVTTANYDITYILCVNFLSLQTFSARI